MAYNVLLVDDSKAMRSVIAKVLRVIGLKLTIYEASHGREALQLMEQHWIDMVLTDIHMPGLNGLDLIRSIREKPAWQDTPVLVISTEGRDDFLEESENLHVSGYLKKPFQPKQLRNVILNALEANDEIVETTDDIFDDGSDF